MTREEYIAGIPTRQKLVQISLLKGQLAESDYKALKYAEGVFTQAEYLPIKQERQALRDEINRLEAEIAEQEAVI